MPSVADREKSLETALAQIDRQFGKGSLVDTEQSTCSTHLWASDHDIPSERDDAYLNR